MIPMPAPRLPESVVTRLVPRAAGSSWTPDPDQGVLLWDSGASAPVSVAPPAAPVDSAELRAWATRFAQAVMEVVAGHRPPAQLVRHTSRAVYRDLERRTRLAQRVATSPGGAPVRRSTLRPQVHSVHVCPVAAGVAEASVHVRHGRRSRAVAMRLEERHGRWTCTAMEFA